MVFRPWRGKWTEYHSVLRQLFIAPPSGTPNPFGVEATWPTGVFGAGSATISALAAGRQESVSPAMELGLSVVKTGHVSEARR